MTKTTNKTTPAPEGAEGLQGTPGAQGDRGTPGSETGNSDLGLTVRDIERRDMEAAEAKRRAEQESADRAAAAHARATADDTRNSDLRTTFSTTDRPADMPPTNSNAAAVKDRAESRPGILRDGDGTPRGSGNAGEFGTVTGDEVGRPLAARGGIEPSSQGAYSPPHNDETEKARTDGHEITQPGQRLLREDQMGGIPSLIATVNLPPGSEPRHIDTTSGADIVQ